MGSIKFDRLSLSVNPFLALSVPNLGTERARKGLNEILGFWLFCAVGQLMSPHRARLHVAAAKLYARTLVATLYHTYHRGSGKACE